jgi:hypothetical protein
MLQTKKYKCVYVNWIDAESDAGWQDKAEIKKWIKEECLVHEIGWVVDENAKYLVISNQILYDGGVGNKTKIPKKWIKSIRRIRI